MSAETRKRNLSELSESSNPSPVNQPKRSQKVKQELQNLTSKLDLNMELSESPDERFLQLDTKMSSLSEKVEGILTAENTELPKDRYAQVR